MSNMTFGLGKSLYKKKILLSVCVNVQMSMTTEEHNYEQLKKLFEKTIKSKSFRISNPCRISV